MITPIIISEELGETNYEVDGQCLECGGPFITGLYDGRKYHRECLTCGADMDIQFVDFVDAQAELED